MHHFQQVLDNMRFLAVFTLYVAAVSAVRIHKHAQRIVGGSVTTIDQYPSMAALLYTWDFNTYWQDCGGIILNSRSILTAAQCGAGDPVSRWRFRVGSSWANSGGVVHAVNQIILHPSYNPNTMDGDISILRSVFPIVFDNNVRPAPIAGRNYNLTDNQTVWAAGWGDLYAGANAGSEQLRHVQVMSINQDTCRNNYAAEYVLITSNMLCSGWPTGGRDQCTYDCGGPLYHNSVVVGVRSFSIGCGEAKFPGVSTRVSKYATWISINA